MHLPPLPQLTKACGTTALVLFERRGDSVRKAAGYFAASASPTYPAAASQVRRERREVPLERRRATRARARMR